MAKKSDAPLQMPTQATLDNLISQFIAVHLRDPKLDIAGWCVSVGDVTQVKALGVRDRGRKARMQPR